MKTDDEKAADELLLMRLLAGYHVDQDGVEVTDFRLTSREERRAREVLAQQLRDGSLAWLTKELLALAIDPDTPSAQPDLWPTRKIVFQRPPKGGSLTWARDRAIIFEIKKRRRQGETDEDAVTGAAERYGLERSRTWEIWTAWKKACLENPSDQKATSSG
jgi:hypothetical protein